MSARGILGKGWILIAVLLTGCATLFSGTRETITVSTNPRDARIYLNGEMVGKGTATFVATRTVMGPKPVLKVERPGYVTQEFPLQTQLNNTALLNLTSVYSWTTDFVSGAMFQYEPNTYHVQLLQKGRASLSDDQMVERFVLVNAASIRKDVAKGGGEYLDALVSMGAPDTTSQARLESKLLDKGKTIVATYEPLALAALIKAQLGT